MGMLYVLDEPSIGLHPKDNVKMIATLESLRDIGNTVIVVEHDEDTIRAADHIVEMGPGPGRARRRGRRAGHARRRARVQGVADRAVPLGQARSIATPAQRRTGNGKALIVRGARENNLKNVDVTFPLGTLVAITGASGSGKSTLVNEILYKALWKRLVDTRTLPGEHDGVDGLEHVHKVVNIDQSPIGRNSRSNPATYIGFYDTIRDLFTQAPLSVERGYKPGRFSFNVKGGRCEECQGEGVDHDAALLHARRRGDLRRVQGRALQQRDARGDAARQDDRRRAEHVDRGGRRRSSPSEPAIGTQDRGAERPRARLPDARPVGDDAVGRRGAARSRSRPS